MALLIERKNHHLQTRKTFMVVDSVTWSIIYVTLQTKNTIFKSIHKLSNSELTNFGELNETWELYFILCSDYNMITTIIKQVLRRVHLFVKMFYYTCEPRADRQGQYILNTTFIKTTKRFTLLKGKIVSFSFTVLVLTIMYDDL